MGSLWKCFVGGLTALCLGGALVSARAQCPPGMVCVSNGVFRSLTDAKEVPVNSFLLDVEPVTNEKFLEFVRGNPRWQRSQVKRIFADESYLKNWVADLDRKSTRLN